MNGRKIEWPWIAAIVAAAVVLAVTLLLPLGFDNDLYESMGWALYAYHGLPYLGSWDHNFPGIVFIHWASIALFGASDFGFRFFDYLVHLAMAGLYYRVLRYWLSPIGCFFGVLLYSLYYACGLWGLAGQRDTYAGFFLLACVALFLAIRISSSRFTLRSFFIGFFCFCTFLLRPTYALFGLSFLILLWMETKRFRAIGFFLIGAVLPIVAFLLPYLFVPHGLEQVCDTIIRFNLDVYASVSIPINIISSGRWPIYAFAIVGIVCIVFFKHKSVDRRDWLLFSFLAVSALISPIAMGKYFSYHLEPLLILLIGIAAYGFFLILSFIPTRFLKIAFAFAAVALYIYAYYPRQLLRYYFDARSASASPLETTYERVLSDRLFGLAQQNDVIRYVNHSMSNDEPVEYISIFPSLRWRMHRPTPTRFTSIVPLSAYRNYVPAYSAAWRKEFIDTLITDPPRVMIVSQSKAWWPFVGKTNDSAIRSIPSFDSILSSNYHLDTTIGGYAIYRSNK